jgi:hypothetical protein
MDNPIELVNNWFKILDDLQSACNFNTGLAKMNSLEFANANILQNLPTTNQQQLFIIRVKQNPGYDLATGDLSANATFEALLDSREPLPFYVALTVRPHTAAPYCTQAVADLLDAPLDSAMPGGSAGPAWTGSLSDLKAGIRPVCFTATFQTAVAATVDAAKGKKVSDLINQIAKLG